MYKTTEIDRKGSLRHFCRGLFWRSLTDIANSSIINRQKKQNKCGIF